MKVKILRSVLLALLLISTVVVSAKPPAPEIELLPEIQEKVKPHVQLRNHETGPVTIYTPIITPTNG